MASLSYNLTPPNPSKPWQYTKGFKTAALDDWARIARGISSYVWSGIVWKDGERRGANFLHSDLCVLDFDDGEMTLEQAQESFCDLVHVIGTTKSHQLAKDGKPACDRFRVIFPWAERITDPDVYAVNMEALCRKYPMDAKTKDLARYFFPCTKIVSVCHEGFSWEVLKNTRGKKSARLANIYRASKYLELQAKLGEAAWPFWLRRFLAHGVLVSSGGRNNTIYAAACALKGLGIAEMEAQQMLNAAPFPRDGWRESELDSALRSAYKK